MSARTRGAPLSRFERWFLSPLLFIMRAAVVAVSLAIWTALLPLWLFRIARSVAVLSMKNVVNVWRGAGTIDVASFEHEIVLWPRGCVAIIRILVGDYAPADLRPRHPLETLQDTLLCILFYSSLIISAQLAGGIAPYILFVREAVLPSLQQAGLALLELVRSHVALLF